MNLILQLELLFRVGCQISLPHVLVLELLGLVREAHQVVLFVPEVGVRYGNLFLAELRQSFICDRECILQHFFLEEGTSVVNAHRGKVVVGPQLGEDQLVQVVDVGSQDLACG